MEHLAEELVAAGHTVAAACIAREPEPKSVRGGVTVYRMAHHNDFWLEDWPKATRVGRAWAKLKQQWNFAIAAEFGRVLDDFRPDIVNTHSLLDVSTLVWREAAKRGIPIVHTVCEYDLICGNAAMFRNGKPCDAVAPRLQGGECGQADHQPVGGRRRQRRHRDPEDPRQSRPVHAISRRSAAG